jgi:hypothetical protein
MGSVGGDFLDSLYSWDQWRNGYQWKNLVLKTKTKMDSDAGRSLQKELFSRGLGALVHHHGVPVQPENLL